MGKIIEWREENKYNSFSSYKGLAFSERYKQIANWMDNGKYKLPPPIECNLDPFAACNLDCYFCIVQRYLKHHREELGERTQLRTGYIINLVDFLAVWGVKGLCISGGGEPTLHKGLPKIVAYAKDLMDVAVVTNATNLFEELLYCRWVALSVDAATRETYQKIKGRDLFAEVTESIRHLAETRKQKGYRADLAFKFLVCPENQQEIYDACKLAKELGVQDFHARPVDLERKDIENNHKPEFNLESIMEQFEKCHELEDEHFRVYTVTHKFDEAFHVKHDFGECLASPLILPILSDGNGYLCVEHKMDARYKLGSAYPHPESIMQWWGSDKHRQMIKAVVPESDCSRCIYCEYHKQYKAIKEDRMCLSFP